MTTIANKFKLSKKVFFASILFLLLIILGSSSSQAVFIPEGYSSYEYHKLLDFLNLYAGQSKNGDYLTGFNFKPAEPETWTGIIWAEVGPYKHVTSISFNNYQMKGDLDVSGFQALEKLDLRQAQLGEIDARNCPNLKEVNLAMDSLEDILLTDPPLLEKFSISQGSLTSFDFSWAVNLKELAISNIDLITSLDLASNSKLISLSLVLENLESVNFSPSLEKLDISGCENLEVDFSNLSSLKEFACNGLDASTFPLSSLINLENLECQYSSLTSLDLTSLNKLQRLNCGSVKLIV